MFPPERAVGACWNYSDPGYIVTVALIHAVSGARYCEHLREHVFTPSGMPNIRIIFGLTIVPHRASGHLVDSSGYRHQDWVSPKLNTTGDGSTLLSLRDLNSWKAVERRRGLLSSAIWQSMQSPSILCSRNKSPCGQGAFLNSLRGQQVSQHGGAWQESRTHMTRYAHGASSPC